MRWKDERERKKGKRKRDGVNESVNENDIQPQTQHNRLFFVCKERRNWGWEKGGGGFGNLLAFHALCILYIYLYIFFLYLYGWMENGDNRSIILYMSFMIGW